MKKRLLAVLLFLCLALAGCGDSQPQLHKYSGTVYGAFDTVTQLTGYAPDEESFNRVMAEMERMLLHYHRIFDGYHAYEGVHNLYEVNLHAGEGPVQAEKELIDLLLWAKDVQPGLHDRVNIALGAVLSIWHEYREAGTAVPPEELLRDAALHTALSDVLIDAEKGTVQYLDPRLTLDLGAVAKGYTVEIIASRLLTSALPSYIMNAGGNVKCGESPRDGRLHWGIAVQDPGDGKTAAPSGQADILYLEDTSIVTSGDYQRFYTVDGVSYHHLIDPDTLFPGRHMRSVTVVTKDSAFADALSTALFLMPYAEGRAFVDALEGAEAFWVLNDRTIAYTDGLKDHLGSNGANAVK